MFGAHASQKQRIAIARVLLRDSPVVILDEFTSALDAKTEESLLRSVDGELEGKTVLLITHRPSSLGLADRVVTLGPEGSVLKDERRVRLRPGHAAHAAAAAGEGSRV